MKELTKGWSRRKFLNRVGEVAGAGALYETMIALGMVNLPTEWSGIPKLKNDKGEGKKVLILGAGIGGLTTAYLLNKGGYDCKIIEAAPRAGGRNFTARKGDTVTEIDEAGNKTVQTCKMDEGLYVNMGPGRLPYHHRRVLGYCRDLGVKLEPYIMNTTANLFQTDKSFEGKPLVYRQIQNDTRGYIAELLAKAINQNTLDDFLTNQDLDRLKFLDLLKVFGPLDKSTLKYEGSTRTGCADADEETTPNVYYNCQVPPKETIKDLINADFWNDSFYDPIEFEWQPTLFQPVGGMDKIVDGFVDQVGHLITLNASVTEIQVDRDSKKVTVTYRDKSGKSMTETADYCISNIPCPILNRIPNNFQSDFKKAVERTTFGPSCKVGWQCDERFWENDNYQIYGGISFTNDIIEQIWYPSSGIYEKKGTLTGAYIHGSNAKLFGKFGITDRIKIAKDGGAKLHPEFNDEKIVPTDKGITIAWQYVLHQEGAWPSWGNNQHDDSDYRRLLEPDSGLFFIVGDQASTLPGWQEGAMMSAEHVVELLVGKKSIKDIPQNIQAPNTFKVLQGRG